MRYYPVFVDLDRAPVLVVGGQEAAAQKVRLLRKTRARIRVVADRPCEELHQQVMAGTIEHLALSFEPALVDGCRLVFAATGDRLQDAAVSFAARSRNIPVNVVDAPQMCSFTTPAIVDRDPVVVAIGTEGTAPVLARRIKAQLEALLPSRLGTLARIAGRLRDRASLLSGDGSLRRKVFERFFDSDIARNVLAGHSDTLEEPDLSSIDALAARSAEPGRVTLVGAGPGDPDLLTFKAMRALQEADVIVVDRLVPDAIIEVARRDARRIAVGKTPHAPSTRQEDINAILVREARAGHRVVRLKGGDPLIFGRAAEEIEALQAHGIEVSIIPGITSALAAAASAGALLTERDAARSLTILTGHASDGPAQHDWATLARPGQVHAIYMGMGAASSIERGLLDAGIDPATPVTIVERATLRDENIVQTRIDALARTATSGNVRGPAIILIGARALLARPAALPQLEAA
ncbi:MAG: siroheme synthase CysG [Geminicoccaceae bacterium]